MAQLAKPTVLVDTREKYPFADTFFEPEFNIETTKLDTGDYTIKGMDKIFVVERKANWAELYSDFSPKYRKAQNAAFHRLATIPYHVMFITDSFAKMAEVRTPTGFVPESKILYIYTQLQFYYKLNVQVIGTMQYTIEKVVKQTFHDIWRMRKHKLI